MSLPQQSDRAFGLTFAVVFAIIAGVGWLAFNATLLWAAAVSAAFLTLALAAPWLLMPLNRLWGRLAYRISLLSNFIILGLFFYIFVFPFGLILRLFGNDPMSRSMDSKKESYWTPVGRNANKETFHDMF